MLQISNRVICCHSVALLTSKQFENNSVPVANNSTAARILASRLQTNSESFTIVLLLVENFQVALIEVVAQEITSYVIVPL